MYNLYMNNSFSIDGNIKKDVSVISLFCKVAYIRLSYDEVITLCTFTRII